MGIYLIHDGCWLIKKYTGLLICLVYCGWNCRSQPASGRDNIAGVALMGAKP